MVSGSSVQTGLSGFGKESAQVAMFGESNTAAGQGGKKETLVDVEKEKAKEAAKPLPGQMDLPESKPKEKQSWEMTSNEYRKHENEPKLKVIHEALASGKPLVFYTHLHATKLTNPGHIRLDSEGYFRVPSGNKSLVILDDQVNQLLAQAGIKPTPFEERKYHHAEVREAIKAKKNVPAEVLKEYPELNRKSKPETSTASDPRSPHAKAIDNALLARKVTTDSEFWAKHRNDMDLEGIDTPKHGKVKSVYFAPDKTRTHNNSHPKRIKQFRTSSERARDDIAKGVVESRRRGRHIV
jgi:hypothetical protein